MPKSKPALNGLGRMEAFKSVEEANEGIVEHAFEWEWFTQKYCAADYQLVHTVGEGMFVTIDHVGGNPDRDTFDVLHDYAEENAKPKFFRALQVRPMNRVA